MEAQGGRSSVDTPRRMISSESCCMGKWGTETSIFMYSSIGGVDDYIRDVISGIPTVAASSSSEASTLSENEGRH